MGMRAHKAPRGNGLSFVVRGIRFGGGTMMEGGHAPVRPSQFRMARTCASNLGSRSTRKSPPHLLHFPAQDSSSCWARMTTPHTSFRGIRCRVIAMNWLPVAIGKSCVGTERELAAGAPEASPGSSTECHFGGLEVKRKDGPPPIPNRMETTTIASGVGRL